MEEPRIDKTIYTGRPENDRGASRRRKSQCTIFWTALGLNIKEQIMKH